jgi:hypothetical protein
MNLSTHFTLAEFCVSDTAARAGICNDPPDAVIAALTRTAQGLEAVRVRLGFAPIIVTSGYRSIPLNRLVRSKDSSQHIKGQACDFICPRFGTPTEIAAALRDSGIEYDQLIIEFSRWVHISFADKPRHMALQIDATGTSPMFS